MSTDQQRPNQQPQPQAPTAVAQTPATSAASDVQHEKLVAQQQAKVKDAEAQAVNDRKNFDSASAKYKDALGASAQASQKLAAFKAAADQKQPDMTAQNSAKVAAATNAEVVQKKTVLDQNAARLDASQKNLNQAKNSFKP